MRKQELDISLVMNSHKHSQIRLSDNEVAHLVYNAKRADGNYLYTGGRNLRGMLLWSLNNLCWNSIVTRHA
jgi:hypothetical protein